MDPYSILGVARGCTRAEVKEAFRRRVHRAHPDRGGDGEAFVRLCTAYRAILDEIDRDGEAADEGPPPAGASREEYAAWMLRFAEGASRRGESRAWWQRHPARARAVLLGLIGLCAVLVLLAAMALGLRGPGRPSASRRAWSAGVRN